MAQRHDQQAVQKSQNRDHVGNKVDQAARVSRDNPRRYLQGVPISRAAIHSIITSRFDARARTLQPVHGILHLAPRRSGTVDPDRISGAVPEGGQYRDHSKLNVRSVSIVLKTR